MEFSDYRTMYDVARRTGRIDKTVTVDTFYNFVVGPRSHEVRMNRLRGFVEQRWYKAGRPYYIMYPYIADALSKVPLDVDSTLLRVPMNELVIRLPKTGWNDIQCIMVAEKLEPPRMIAIWIDCYDNASGLQRTVTITEGCTVEQQTHSDMQGLLTPAEIQRTYHAVRLALACALLDQNDPLVSPDVLTKDRPRLTPENAEALHEKAKRRGKFGWVVGTAEVSPHLRRPHFSTRWTGPGGKIPKLVSIAATMVHRRKVTTVPTGTMDTPPQP